MTDPSQYFGFNTCLNHDDAATCLYHCDYLELVIGRSPLFDWKYYGVMFQDDGSMTIRGQIKYLAVTNYADALQHFPGFAVRSITRGQAAGFSTRFVQQLQVSLLFAIKIRNTGDGNLAFLRYLGIIN